MKFMATDSSITLIMNKGIKMIPKSSPLFAEFKNSAAAGVLDEAEVSRIEGDFTFDVGDITLEYNEKTGSGEFFHHGKYHMLEPYFVELFKDLTRLGFPKIAFTNFIRSLQSSCMTQPMMIKNIETMGWGMTTEGKLICLKPDYDEIQNFEIEKDVTLECMEGSNFETVEVWPSDMFINDDGLATHKFVVIEDLKSVEKIDMLKYLNYIMRVWVKDSTTELFSFVKQTSPIGLRTRFFVTPGFPSYKYLYDQLNEKVATSVTQDSLTQKSLVS